MRSPAGEESEGQMAYRGAFAVAEHGQPGQPDAFAAKLREVLAARAA
jgi:hypothetical protein